jgi:hypothetical protein
MSMGLGIEHGGQSWVVFDRMRKFKTDYIYRFFKVPSRKNIQVPGEVQALFS